jgi:hypothetical protein
MRLASSILAIAALGFICGCHKPGSRALGELGLSDQDEVRFAFRSEPPFALSTNAAHRLVSTLRADARYIDGRDLTAAPYGKFLVGGREFYLFQGFISDDVNLHGRAWYANWIDSGFSFWITNGIPDTAAAWHSSLESLLSESEAQQGGASNQR